MRKKRRQIDMPPSYVIEHLDEAIEKHWVRVHYQAHRAHDLGAALRDGGPRALG